MNKIIKTVIALTASLPLLFAGLVSAQTPPANPANGSTAAQRLEQRKAERKIVLEDKDQKRLLQVCTNVQAKISQLRRSTTPAFTERGKLYQRIDANLWVVIGQLKLAEKDTFELEKDRAALAAKTATFQTTLKNYQEVLDDMAVINCQADVVGFKALLETARLYFADLRTQSANIKAQVVDTIKKRLNDHISEL